MTARFIPADVAKEIRALAPIWAGCAVALAASQVLHDSFLAALARFSYLLGVLALGAHAIGHEYAHRTLGPLLAQPVSRRRMLFVKLGVAASMIALLTLVAVVAAVPSRTAVQGYSTVALLTAAGALCLAPVLVMIARSTLAGVVLTLVVPLALLLIGDLAGIAIYGVDAGAPIDRLKSLVLLWGTLGSTILGLAGAWYAFMHLEALDGQGAAVTLPRLFRRATTARRYHPIWALVKKELNLQQLSFLLVALFLAAWGIVALLPYFVDDMRVRPFMPLVNLYMPLMAVIVGATASAEERQLGTHESQLLLPIGAWWQWAIKTAVVLGLVLLLGLALPLLLIAITPGAADVRSGMPTPARAAGIELSLAAGSLYASSLASSGLKALVSVLPAIALSMVYAQMVIWILLEAFRPIRRTRVPASVAGSIDVLLVAGLAALFIVLGFHNYRTSERSARRVAVQVALVAVYLALLMIPRLVGVL
jgi:ABC-type transport system involved in multi-copper enzyme maturation permease subunit